MGKIIVSVQRQGDSNYKDIELSSSITGKYLLQMTAELFGKVNSANSQEIQYDIRVDPPGRMLGENQTLQDANIWDGAWLTFVPRNIPQPIQTAKYPVESQTDQPKPEFPWTEIELD